jgi:BirA family biotin operon repressor/biotin-[acetyl-CoA-carboxylase] ligase
MQLDPKVAAGGVRLIAHDSIGSTNTEALMLARAGERGPLWITAAQQTAGRGRRGNGWISEPGNLYASLLLSDPAPPPHTAELSLVAALAVHDAVMAVAPSLGVRLAVKWPNDLLVGGAKFAGILIEAEGSAAVIGIGVNCVQHPVATAYPATDLAAAGAAVSPERLFAGLSNAMDARLAQWSRGTAFASIRADWLARATGLGQQIRVRLPQRELSGQFESLDQSGRLVLRLADGSLETVSAGEVFALAEPEQMLSAQG